MPDFNGNGVDDVEEVNDWLIKRGLKWVAKVWMAGYHAVEGVKTFTLASTMAFIGLIDQMGGVDLLQTIRGQVSDDSDPRIGKWLMGLMMAFIVLNFLTKREKPKDAETDAAEAAAPAAPVVAPAPAPEPAPAPVPAEPAPAPVVVPAGA